MKTQLDEIYSHFNLANSVADPIWIVRRYERPDDREIVAFCAAALAFGRVQSVMQSIEGLLAAMGPSPAAFVRGFDPSRHRTHFDHLGHRWTRGVDMAALVWLLHQMVDRDGSIEGFFAHGLAPDAVDVGGALESFSTRALALDVNAIYGRTRPKPCVAYFFSRPSSGGACKRLNLFLRWMVRHDRVDLGVWSRVRPAQLIVPLDTASLRELDPADPVKYDFSICHVGMMNACGYGTDAADAQCPLKGICRPRRSRRG